MIWIVASLLLIVILLEVSTLVMFGRNFKSYSVIDDEEQLPFVSILVAARNEELNLEKCLWALSRLDYPKSKFEILIGNDSSVDGTAGIIWSYCMKDPIFKSVEIQKEYQGLVAKSKVLAQLINQAEGDYVAFIDADMAVTPRWLRQMTAPLSSGHAIVSGYSEVIAKGPFARFQYYDWLNALHFLKSLSDTMKPVTTLGNNMIVNLADYRSVGGFEGIGPNLIEDLALLKVMQKKGFKATQIVIKEGRARTLAVRSLMFWISQRKRWIKGALNGPFYERVFLIIQRLMIPIGFSLCFFDLEVGLFFVIVKILIEGIKSVQMHLKTTRKPPDVFLMLSPIINSILDTFALIGLLFNRSVKWKDRQY